MTWPRVLADGSMLMSVVYAINGRDAPELRAHYTRVSYTLGQPEDDTPTDHAAANAPTAFTESDLLNLMNRLRPESAPGDELADDQESHAEPEPNPAT